MSSATASAIIVTESAREKILELRDAENDADRLALRIAVTGVRGVDYAYDLAFELMDEADANDEPFHVGDGLSVLIPGSDVDKHERPLTRGAPPPGDAVSPPEPKCRLAPVR